MDQFEQTRREVAAIKQALRAQLDHALQPTASSSRPIAASVTWPSGSLGGFFPIRPIK